MSLCPHGYTAFWDCPECPEPMGTAPAIRPVRDPRMRDEDGFLTEHDPEPRFPRRPPEEDDE